MNKLIIVKNTIWLVCTNCKKVMYFKMKNAIWKIIGCNIYNIESGC